MAYIYNEGRARHVDLQTKNSKNGVIPKIIHEMFGGIEKTPYLCTQMRVAYRRDNIKLRSRLNY